MSSVEAGLSSPLVVRQQLVNRVAMLVRVDSAALRGEAGRSLADLLGDSGGLGAAAPFARFG